MITQKHKWKKTDFNEFERDDGKYQVVWNGGSHSFQPAYPNWIVEVITFGADGWQIKRETITEKIDRADALRIARETMKKYGEID
jgi:hypothetical protein